MGPRRRRACWRAKPISSRRSSSPGSKPGRSVTKALTTSPATGSGTPMTPASTTAGCSMSTLSTSNGPDQVPGGLDDVVGPAHEPERSRRASRRARSPVRYQPPAKHFGVALVLVQVAPEHRGPARPQGQLARRRRGPRAPVPRRRSPGPGRPSPRASTAASTPGRGRPIEPGRMSPPARLAIMIPPVSVCHQLSWIGRPRASWPQITASGFSGSPTLATKRRRGQVVLAGPGRPRPASACAGPSGRCTRR